MRAGGWIQTYTGVAFYPLDPMEEDINIEDIAHSLSMQCRYTGHVKEFYSVAQHSYHVADFCDEKHSLYGLLHDASEAYLTDVAGPIKGSLGNYKDIEKALQDTIYRRFGLDPQVPRNIKHVDRAILKDEARCLMPTVPKGCNLDGEGLGLYIEPWSPYYAKKRFLKRFNQLYED